MILPDLKTIIDSKSPGFFERWPGFLSTSLLRILERIVHVDELQEFFTQHGDKKNWQFIEAVFDYLDFSYMVTAEDRKKIPPEGRLICVANHVTGPLDGLILLHMIGEIRQDVKIVLTDILAGLENLADLFLLYDQYTPRLQKQNILAIRQALLAEQVVIFFPAGEVTKLSWQGLKDQAWQTGPVSLARKYGVPILPISLHARNSLVYYLAALIHRNFSTLLLAHEMFRKRSTTIPVKIGDLLQKNLFTAPGTDITTQTESLKEQVHRI
jgi:putative hemolysin